MISKGGKNMKMRRFYMVCGLICVFSMIPISATPIAEIKNHFENKAGISHQSKLLLFEGFEDGIMPPPSGWYLNESNPDFGWFIGEQGVYDGSFCGWMNFDNTNEKDNRLISPDIDLTDYSSLLLSFWAKSDTKYPGATVEVHIKGNGFDDIVWDLIKDESWDLFEWHNVNIDISSYTGKTINISWRYIGKGGESFGLDDIVVTDEVGGNLSCTGSLTWNDVKPGETVNGNFNVLNTGSQGSNLNWEITEYPDWGNWTFEPLNGKNLKPEDGSIMVKVSVIAPDEKNANFTGQIKVVNTDNPTDFETIQISLITPISKPHFTILEERFPRLFNFLSNIFQRI
jgi:hypothetical protein